MADSVTVTGDRFPNVRVGVNIRGESRVDWALVDTGFTGSLVVPESWMEMKSWMEMNLGAPDGRIRLRVADRRVARAPLYYGSLEIVDLAVLQDVTCAILGDRYIVGLEIISLFKVTLDHGERLTIEL